MTVAETVSVCACGAPLYEGETRCQGCVLADTPWAERVAVLRDALREAGVVPLDDVPVSPWGPDAAREVALYRVLCTGALRTLAEYALEHRPYPPEPVLEVREGRLGYTARRRVAPQCYRFERVDVGIFGTTQVEDWAGGDPVRAAAVEEALAYESAP